MDYRMVRKITSPEEFFGFRLGSDRRIARWDRIVEYFRLLERESDEIRVVDMGPTTEGNPFLLVIISSADNLRNLERLREINLRLSDPRGLSDEEAERLIEEGRAVICQSMSLHATEIGGTQMAPELAYELLTRMDEEAVRIRENVVFLMVPCFNPDGQIMVTDWYNKWLGTEYEGCDLPWLYHKYVGHDNNRDAFMTNMVESRYMAKILFRDWIPQAYQDHHHMGSYGARLYVAPYCEPIHPHADPLIWREHSWYGAHMALKLEEAGKSGVINGAQFLGWGHLGFHWIGNYHNIASMLTESASAKLATPIYIHPGQLRGDGRGPIRGFPHYKPQTNFPNPWPGGWWRLRDIVEQQKIASWALLDLAARYRETVLRNAYLKAKRQIERGMRGRPYAYIIPTEQHDPLTAEKLIEKLLVQGVEIKRAKAGFTAEGRIYGEGSYIISLDQPKMGLVKTLLGRTIYPDDAWTREADGSPSRPQDTATDTMAEYMGVRVDEVQEPFQAEAELVKQHERPVGRLLGESSQGYVFDPRLNDSFTALNLLLDKGLKIERFDEALSIDGVSLPHGAFMVEGGCEGLLREAARLTGVDFVALRREPEERRHEVRRLRVGLYQRYWGGNMDEGWTRWLLEQFGFPYKSIRDEEVKRGQLNDALDAILIPDDATPFITGIGVEEWMREHRPDWPMPFYPPEYRGGIGDEGVKALNDFVEGGGTLITLGGACDFAIEKLGLNVKNPLKGLKPKDFFCPGSTLRAHVDNTHPLGYGMPENTLVFFWNNPAFEIIPSRMNELYEVVVQYPERDILQSGWLIGEERISKRIGMLVARKGKGKVVLIGFRPQHRCQTHGTYKLLFNALIS
jgi:hypothetical protein